MAPSTIKIFLDTTAIIGLLHATAILLTLHGANPFQVKHYSNAAFFLEKLDKEILDLNHEKLYQVQGIPKNLLALIEEIRTTGTLQRWQDLMVKTPPGVWNMLELPGLGPKKVRLLWQELGIENLHDLAQACKLGQVAQVPGFGNKTQATILENLALREKYQQKFHYATALAYASTLEAAFKKEFPALMIALVGNLRRKVEVVNVIEWLIGTSDTTSVMEWLSKYPDIQQDTSISGPFAWRGHFITNQLLLHAIFCTPADFYKQLIIQTGSAQHLALPVPSGRTLGQVISQAHHLNSEAEGYQQASIPYIPPELREGLAEKAWIATGTPTLVEADDLKGVLHVHTKYSDGQHSLTHIATYCKELGYSYIGITDHSQSAAYAGGLRPHTIQEQHQVIDELNQQLAPFRIFKGIESDILPDGNLDYPYDILAQFDFIIASVHMGLSMNQQKATERLIKAIKNPFTTLLGHPTGRLLLKREGYPIDHQAVIDACAAHGIVIELNANPWRLDLDWHWIPYAIQKGVKLSINPDAHNQNDFSHLSYGVYIGRKGGLTKPYTFNALTGEEVANYFQQRKLLAIETTLHV